LFIIGKNFMKGTVVVFEEVKNDHVIWSSEADIDLDFFQAVSLHKWSAILQLDLYALEMYQY